MNIQRSNKYICFRWGSAIYQRDPELISKNMFHFANQTTQNKSATVVKLVYKYLAI
jgi:hypothetical protein